MDISQFIENKQSDRIQMKKSNVEGECLIEEINLLQRKISMIILGIILSILTGGIFLLILYWFFKIRLSFLYSEVKNISLATHVLIKNSDETFNIIKLNVQENNGVNSMKIGQQQQKYQRLSDNNNNYQQIQEQYNKTSSDEEDHQISQTIQNTSQNYNNQIATQSYTFTNRKLNYIYNETTLQDNNSNNIKQQYFEAIEYPVCQMSLTDLKQKIYLTEEQININRSIYGKCEKQIELPNIFKFMLKEMTTPFFFLQYVSIVLWIFEDYLQFAIIIFSLSIVITVFNFILLRISLVKIQSMAHQPQEISLLRKKLINNQTRRGSLKIQSVDSKEIVVGDIIILQEKLIIPCDCVLISGETLMNEVTLTGESLPIPKEPIPHSDILFSYSKELRKHLLFEGTEINQCKGDENKQILAKVIRVGFSSFKGQILRSVLFPKPVKFEYYVNSMKFLLGLLCVMLIIFFSRIYEMYKLDFPNYFYFYRFFDTVTWIIPPFLPIFISLGQTLALMRLKLNQIYGIDPSKTFASGKVTHMCFDKTGTLTQNGINVNGYYDETLTNMTTIEDIKNDQTLLNNIQHKLFSTCHGAYLVNGELIGDILDIEMLKFSNYNIINVEEDISIKFKSIHPNNQNELQVIKVFEFSSDYQRMSCIVYDVQLQQYYFFLKGAPEKVAELCHAQTLPQNFNNLQNKLSLKGFRIIALAFQDITNIIKNKNILNIEREELEKELQFKGLLILENRLKEDTSQCMQSLIQAQIECKIISGDNPLTTLQTGIECGILDNNNKIFYIDIEQDQLQFFKIENEIIQPYQLNLSKQQILRNILNNNEQIVITGKTLDYFLNSIKKVLQCQKTQLNLQPYSDSDFSFDTNSQEDISINQLSKISNRNSKNIKLIIENQIELCNNLIKNTAIFSRMRPEQKRIIVENLQNQGFKVGMIGDGANDCAAIKQGDIGISFATADAAFSAPFSSTNDSIKCVESILLEGRCTMTINIEIFRTIVTQNVLKYLGVMILLQEAQNFGGFQYTFLSFLCGMPLLVFLTLSKPQKKLQPYTPDDRFQGISNSLSMYSQIIIYGVGFIIGYYILINEKWHIVIKELDEDNGLKIYNMEGELNSIIFLMINLFYITSCLTYYISYPYKQNIMINIILSIWIVITFCYAVVMIVKPQYTMSALDIESSLQQHSSTMVYILITALIASLLILIIEELVIKKYFGPKKIKDIQNNNKRNVSSAQ